MEAFFQKTLENSSESDHVLEQLPLQAVKAHFQAH